MARTLIRISRSRFRSWYFRKRPLGSPETKSQVEGGRAMAATTTRAFCSECGAKLDPDAKFCASCGHLVGAAAVEPAATGPVSPLGDDAASDAVTSAPVALPHTRHLWQRKRFWLGTAAVLIVLAIIGATGGKKSAKQTTLSDVQSASSAASSAESAPAQPVVPKNLSAARSYISKHGHDINTVQVMVQSVQVAVALAQKGASQDTINQLALVGQQAHDSIDNVRSNFVAPKSRRGLALSVLKTRGPRVAG